jgi:DNA-binding CsgD family transcriptional regulator
MWHRDLARCSQQGRSAADGGTNREIAQALFVTEKTVETHLGRALRKLNINSRRQLPDVLLATAS